MSNTVAVPSAADGLMFGSRLLEELAKDPARLAVLMGRSGSVAQLVQGLMDGPQNSWATYTVTVDYGLTVEQMVAEGKYDWANSDINQKKFPSSPKSGRSDLAISLVKFDRSMTSKEVETELDAQGLRPATVAELLALGAQHPELQRENPIVGLSSRWRNPHDLVVVPVLDELPGKRELDLDWYGHLWNQDCRFAAVSK